MPSRSAAQPTALNIRVYHTALLEAENTLLDIQVP